MAQDRYLSLVLIKNPHFCSKCIDYSLKEESAVKLKVKREPWSRDWTGRDLPRQTKIALFYTQ